MFRLFVTGIFISFLGALPMGTLNMSAMQIAITDGYYPAVLFALGALLVEMIYVRMTLVAMGWFRAHKKLLMAMEWLTLIIILVLAVSSFYTAMHPTLKANPILSNSVHRFWLGAGLSAINPLQVPFWFGWSTVLTGKGILVRHGYNYVYYILGIGIGTFIGFTVFIFGGKLLVDRLDAQQNLIQWILGGIFLITGIIQAVRMLRRKDSISNLK
ncbi:MAG: LysE family translocator [Sphingobacteriales bacterium]|jgi:threonine/homoserine/homoserine lactone efflux protein